MKKLVIAAILSIMINPLSAEGLIPPEIKVVTYSGSWMGGGSEPERECLHHLQSKFPGGRFQILSKGEEGRWTGTFGRTREYRYWCTALVKPS